MPLLGQAELGRIRSQGWEGKLAPGELEGSPAPRREEERSGGEQRCQGPGDLPPKSSGGGSLSETIACLFRIPSYSGIRALKVTLTITYFLLPPASLVVLFVTVGPFESGRRPTDLPQII